MTPDGMPVVGEALRVNGLYLAVGMCGQGFMMGPGIARNLAHLVAKGKPYIESDLFNRLSPERDFYGQKEALK